VVSDLGLHELFVRWNGYYKFEDEGCLSLMGNNCSISIQDVKIQQWKDDFKPRVNETGLEEA